MRLREQETKLVEQLIERKQPEPTVKKKKAAKRRTSRATSQTNVNTSYINVRQRHSVSSVTVLVTRQFYTLQILCMFMKLLV